ncbi:hypothetical protein GP486_002705 [Trichoglossum hirsutum]|uniref:Uncharacterized protein n=1 Tax=Trichoglossum hirsutum TaxID=265104 RepID=A0A9P8LEF7_9PEZI|nr:hypothetical protein GP486_002705 [Trichoglossum hirsutum]
MIRTIRKGMDSVKALSNVNLEDHNLKNPVRDPSYPQGSQRTHQEQLFIVAITYREQSKIKPSHIPSEPMPDGQEPGDDEGGDVERDYRRSDFSVVIQHFAVQLLCSIDQD